MTDSVLQVIASSTFSSLPLTTTDLTTPAGVSVRIEQHWHRAVLRPLLQRLTPSSLSLAAALGLATLPLGNLALTSSSLSVLPLLKAGLGLFGNQRRNRTSLVVAAS